RLDRKTAARDFECAVRGQEPRLAPAVDADERPRRLLAGESSRIRTARRFTRELLHGGVRLERRDDRGRWHLRWQCAHREAAHRERSAPAAAPGGNDE